MTTRRIMFELLAGGSLAFVPVAASAQSDAPQQAKDAAEDGDVPIIVTGSRTIKNGDDSPTPVTVVTYETLQTSKPGTMFEGLTQLPSLNSSRGTNANPSVNGGIGGGNGAASQLNLRNVGATRTLVLFDGHRVPPTLFSGITDMDIIPQNVISRVDLVTGGVSAVYGSDAVTGVINFVTDRKLNGLKGGAQYGISEYGDSQQYSANLAYGRDLGDRGHILLSYEFRNDDGVTTKTSRPWFVYQSAGNPGTVAAPYYMITDARSVAASFTGITTIAGVRYNFAANGTLAPMVEGTAVGNGTIRIGGEGIYDDNGLKAGVRSHQFYARFDYDLTDDIHVSAVGLGNLKKNTLWAGFINLSGISVAQTGNAFLTTQADGVVPGTGAFSISRMINNYDYRYHPVPQTDQYYAALTFDGKIGNFDWQVYGGYGSSTLNTTVYNNINREKVAAAVDAITVGTTVQCASLATRPDCVPLNLLGGTITSAQLDYITDTTKYRAVTTMKDLSAQISGPVVTLPAGDVVAALSGEWREVAFRSTSDHPPDLYANCTGLTRNCVASGPARTVLYANTLPNLARVAQHVWEAAGELTVPLLKDSTIARELSLNGAARFTSYDTSGEYWSWKVGLDWKPINDIKIRATASRDIRAPNLFDIASATTIVPNNINDIIGGTNPVNNVPGYNIPNPTLTSEIGRTYTAGVVFTPSFAPGLSLAVDYFDITVKNAIFTIQGFNQRVMEACQRFIASGGAPTATLACRLQSRDASLVGGAGSYTTGSTITATYISNYNLGFIKTKGVDFEVNYNTTLGGRRVSLRALATWQPALRLNYGNLGLLPVEDNLAGFANGGTAENLPTPKWRGTFFLGLEPVKDLNLDVSYRWRAAMGINANQNWSTKIPSYGIVNVNFAYDIIKDGGHKVQAYVNIANAFNQRPGFQPGTGTPGGFGGWAIGDDWVGRYFTFGTRFKF